MLPMVLSFKMPKNLKIAGKNKALAFVEEPRCFNIRSASADRKAK
jgi:hypothetical protein